jgi:hypothetical protein
MALLIVPICSFNKSEARHLKLEIRNKSK